MLSKYVLRPALKLVLQAVRVVLALLPLRFRVLLRKQDRLLKFYSSALHASQLFYGTASPRIQQKRYIKILKKQEQKLQQLSLGLDDSDVIDCLILEDRTYTLSESFLYNLQQNKRVRRIFILGSSILQALDYPFADTKVQIIDKHTKINDGTGLLLLRTSDCINESGIDAFISYLKDYEVVSCDVDHLDAKGNYLNPECYPQWNPDLQLTTAYLKSGIALKKSALKNSLLEFLQVHQHSMAYALWMVDCYISNSFDSIHHIALSLVHRRSDEAEKWCDALQRYCKNRNTPFKIKEIIEPDIVNLEWEVKDNPLVSIIIPTYNAKELVRNCIDSILGKSVYRNFEIILIDNNSDDADALMVFDKLEGDHEQVRVVKYPYPFNYSAINNFAAKQAKGSIFAFVNNDIEVISPNWLGDMLENTLRYDIGCVGAKLYYSNHRVQHAGVVMGYGGGAGHAHKHFPNYHLGYLHRLAATNNFSAVTAACLMLKRTDFEAVGGFNENDLAVAFNDVDLCLKVAELGKRNLYCASACLFHYESISRGAEDTPEKRNRFERELEYLQNNWQHYIENDPAYNPNLTLRQENFALRNIL